MRALLDVNVLIALFDPIHQEHKRALAWLGKSIKHGWSSCPITQNGFVRVITQPRYPRPVTLSEAVARLEEAMETPHHEFWPDDIRITDSSRFQRDRIHGPKQLTDIYLLALAVHRGGCFVTFDQAIPTSAVPGATAKNLIVL